MGEGSCVASDRFWRFNNAVRVPHNWPLSPPLSGRQMTTYAAKESRTGTSTADSHTRASDVHLFVKPALLMLSEEGTYVLRDIVSPVCGIVPPYVFSRYMHMQLEFLPPSPLDE